MLNDDGFNPDDFNPDRRLQMNLDAWQTVWACVALSVLVILIDGLLAHRAGPGKAESARLQQRNRRHEKIASDNAARNINEEFK